MTTPVVFYFHPGLGNPVQEFQGKRFNPAEHGNHPTFQLSPEGLLFAILIRTVGKSRIMLNPQSTKTVSGFTGNHSCAIIRHKTSR